MSINFIPGQVAQGDPNPGGPTATSNSKIEYTKVVRLTGANFTTGGGTSTLVAVLPADSTITEIVAWKPVQFAGGGITAATLSLGTTASGTQIVNAFNIFGATLNNQVHVNPVTGLMANLTLPLPADINIFATGIATTGNPTSGEVFVTIRYVR
jgi:hypothetical protein